jgi:hypothetical protein
MAAAGRAHSEMFFKWIVMFLVSVAAAAAKLGQSRPSLSFASSYNDKFRLRIFHGELFSFHRPTSFFFSLSVVVVVVVVIINGTSSRRRAASLCCVRVALFGIFILSWTFVSLFSFCLFKFG